MNTKPHEHRWASIKPGYPQKICKCGHMKVGTQTVLLSDLVRYTTTKAATALGDLGMDVTTGRPSGFIGGVNSPLAALSDVGAGSQSVFSFTHDSGAASTGALGFTPRFAIYSFTFLVSGNYGVIGSGIATGTGSLARGTSMGARFDVSGGGSPTGDDAAIAGYFAAPTDGSSTFNTSFLSSELDVTAFGSGGLTLTWTGAVVLHAGKLLVVG